MNYIGHMNAWFAKIYEDNRLHTTHIALYVALFQYWNLNRFQNPITLHREEVMRLAKIGSANTYTKCIKELHQWEYIKYEPSFNPMIGSRVHLYTFDKGSDNGIDKGGDKASERVVRPFIKPNKQNKPNKQGDQNFKDYDEPL